DLESIVELRVGEEALWAVGDESCLPHGTQRLFAIVYYHQMVLKTVCIVAPTNESFYEWFDTLTYLVSSRQPVTTLAQYQRWRLVTINRQWWESDASGESATDAMRFIEVCVGGSQGSTSSLDMTSELASTVAFSSSPFKSATATRKWFSSSGSSNSNGNSSSNNANGASALPTSIVNGARSSSRTSSFSSLIMPTPVFRTNEGGLQQQQQQQQRACSEDAVVDVADTLKKSHAQPSVDSVYHDITLSYLNFPQLPCLEAKSGESPETGLGIELGLDFDRIGSIDAINNDDDGSGEDSDHLIMASSKIIDDDRNDSGYLLHLDIPKSQPFGITRSVFAHFLRDTQKEDVSDDQVRQIFCKFTSHSDQQVMTAYEFEAYLLSAYNSLGYRPVEESAASDAYKECFDMDKPLNEYYISSSHNTYLAGDQLVSDSTWTVGMVVVESRTTRILFEDVIIAISRYAFAVSPYPVILSFETHCSLQQQARMATILKKHLGDMMVLAPVNGSKESILPSPNQLKHRVIIKNKVLDIPASRPPSLASSQPAAAVLASMGQNTKTVSPRNSTAQLKRKIAPELSQLIVYCKATHFEGLEQDSPEPLFSQVTSVSETTSNQLIRQKPAQYSYYNSAQMTRVYPAFSRFTSTNYNPIPHWAAGCQLVALNFQTRDKNMQIYEAMFQRTRSLGYVLKPKHLRNLDYAASIAQSKAMHDERTIGTVPSSPPSQASSLESAVNDLNITDDKSEFPQRTTVHINVISAHGVVRHTGGNSSGVAGVSSAGHQRRQSLAGMRERRPSFASDSSSRRSSSGFALVDQSSCSPGPLSRPPSGVAMFSNDVPSLFAAASTAFSSSALPATSPLVGQQSLNAAAAAAAAAAASAMASAKSVAGQQDQGTSSRIRVEIEWLSEANFEGSSASSESSSDSSSEAAAHGSGISGPSAAAQSGSGSQSRCTTVPSSPAVMPQHMGAVAFPFLYSSSSFNSVVATPLSAPPPAPTPLEQAKLSDLQIRKNRFATKTGTVNGNEVRWRNASLFRVINDPNISFVRISLFDDDLELASTCISIDSLKEGYRFIELGESDKSKICRPVHLLVNIQISQLHCLASMPVTMKLV
ncbi:1-phosphatidylinositol 4,5-bisphosphate phosphodiesterase delta-1, partial [Coemansia erecta]